MLTKRSRFLSVSLPVALVILLQALTLLPTGINAQCPTMGSEGATFGTTSFNTVKSQMWFNDGLWWGVFSNNNTGIHFYSFPNNAATQGSIIDANITGIPDALWDGTNLFVAVWKSVSLATLYKFTYNSVTKTHTLVSGFPVALTLNGSSTSALVLEKDSTGKLWATYTGTQGGLSDGKVRVIWSTSASHAVWNTTGVELETGLAANTIEISAITHFGGNKIGVAWSNQPAKQIAFRFHVDGDAETTWSPKEIIDSGLGPRGLGGVADDHLSIKGGPDGRIFLAAKDNDNDGTPAHAAEGRIWLYIRTAAGVWGQKTIIQPDFTQLPTRPILLLDVSNNRVYVIYSDASLSGSGRSFIAHSSMNTPFFDTPCVFTTLETSNPTSTKQHVTSSTGIMASASTGATGSNEIIFRSVALPANNNPIPAAVSLSPSSTLAGGVAFTLTVNGADFIPSSVVRWNGGDRVTTFVSSNQVTAAISAADISSAGSANVTVFNPTPGGGLSNALNFTISPISCGWESDVFPRPTGHNNGSITVTDWVQTGRFAAGLDVPAPGCEFQRADSAFRSTLGSGSITVSDWVQAGRYAAGLDPPTPAGGPTGSGSAPINLGPAKQIAQATVDRVVRAAGDTLNAGQVATIRIELDSQGDENALGFSVTFDPTKLTYISSAPGSGASGVTLNENSFQVASGRIGFVMAHPTGLAFAAGMRQLVVMTFSVSANASGSTVIGFGDQPVFREISDPVVNLLTATYSSATLSITSTNAKSTQFSTSSMNVNEGGGSLTVTVMRSGDLSGEATVDYRTVDGTATERNDYTTAIGKLRFAPGESQKTITLLITEDSKTEGPESATIVLSNPTGGVVLGNPSVLTFDITDDLVEPPTNANDDSTTFVRQHYHDFFTREADAPGLAFWKNQIDECTTQACRELRRINVSAAFFLSIEFQQTGYLVYKANQAVFNSGEQLKLQSFLPDTQEIGRGVIIGQPGAELQLETNKQNFFRDFVQRPAFLAPTAYPTTLTAAQFVDKLNGNTFDPLNSGSGPALTPAERDALVAQLSADPTSPTLRAQVLRSISENGPFTQRQFNKAFVLMQYLGYLRRNPNDAPDGDFGGYNFWLGKLNQFNGNFVSAEMVKAFIVSGEYRQRFGP